jgi:hypothetical protein
MLLAMDQPLLFNGQTCSAMARTGYGHRTISMLLRCSMHSHKWQQQRTLRAFGVAKFATHQQLVAPQLNVYIAEVLLVVALCSDSSVLSVQAAVRPVTCVARCDMHVTWCCAVHVHVLRRELVGTSRANAVLAIDARLGELCLPGASDGTQCVHARPYLLYHLTP